MTADHPRQTRAHPRLRSRPQRQRGVAALAMTLLLLGVLALAIAHAGRHSLVVQKAAANQARAAQALAAAEAGIDWAVAMLSTPHTIGDDCQPADAGTTLRDRLLRHDAGGRLEPRGTTAPDGTTLALRPACIADAAGGWDCRCPASGSALPPLPDATDAAARPGFSVMLAALPQVGGVRLVAVGCDHATRACLEAGEAVDGGAVARVQVTLGLLPALATPPAGALTARGRVAATAVLELSSTDPSAGGIALHAGGAFVPGATLRSAPGAPAAAAAVDRDAALAALDEEAMFAATFGIDRTRWRRLPGKVEVDCRGSCDAALAAALSRVTAPTFIHVTGDLRLSDPVAIGTAGQPVVLVVDGSLRLGAGVVLHGLAWVGAATWDLAGSTGGLVRGAVITPGRVVGDGALVVFRDAAVLGRLQQSAGVLVPVPGSWRDF